MAVMPVLAALFLALAPPQITDRFYSMFDAQGSRPASIA